MGMEIRLGDIAVDVELKDIKNVHLSVYPPTGRVRIAAPSRMSLDTIRVFAISKLGWIKRQQAKIRSQERETPREFIDRESHYLWGRRYLLEVFERNAPPAIEVKHNRLILGVRPGTSEARRGEIVEDWYREQLRAAAVPLVARWEPILGVRANRVFVQRMKTKWGGCNPRTRNIRLNTDLAKKPRGCLEYIVVHELVHLIEPTHNPRFVSIMDAHMPQWRSLRDQLNRLPVRHEEWGY
ncbi:M48 family metallopeptidase [Tautonia rosea]|uniref:M48 family metallopeptidase n=1 Tax=Tautonia rosea TaxID=2728037 RepID=UPI001473FFA8|nr:SprT family zinc-dependent metalloprotease [Tautonia rosea]